MAVRARQTKRRPHHAQPSSSLHSTQRGARAPLQGRQAHRQVARHSHSRVPCVLYVPLRQVYGHHFSLFVRTCR